jgi:hypothetical protein
MFMLITKGDTYDLRVDNMPFAQLYKNGMEEINLSWCFICKNWNSKSGSIGTPKKSRPSILGGVTREKEEINTRVI